MSLHTMLRPGALLLTLGLCFSRSAGAVPPPPSYDALQARLARGDRALSRGDSISAIGDYRDAVNRAPRDPRGYVALGRAYLRLHEPKNAREAFEAGLRHSRGGEALVMGLAQSLVALGQDERALAALRALCSQADASKAAFAALADLAQRTGALSEALAARRALLVALERERPAEAAEIERARTQVAALALLLGPADRLSPAHCAERTDSALVGRIAGCH